MKKVSEEDLQALYNAVDRLITQTNDDEEELLRITQKGDQVNIRFKQSFMQQSTNWFQKCFDWFYTKRIGR